MPQWCLTATGVPASEDNTFLFDVGTELCADDEASDDSFRNLALDPVDDSDCDVADLCDVEVVGLALAELRTTC